MPSVKLPRKSTDTDMTPFVDVAFLILSFFIMATKFKPSEAVKITTPSSVLSQELPANNAVLISIDSANRVYYTLMSDKDPSKFDAVLDGLASSQNLSLGPLEHSHFKKTYMVGVPFSQLKGFLDVDPNDAQAQAAIVQPGIPVMDSLNNQLVWWIRVTKDAFAGEHLKFLIKGDGASKYPAFEAVIDALKRNEEFKYNLVTSLENAPSGSDFDKMMRAQKAGK